MNHGYNDDLEDLDYDDFIQTLDEDVDDRRSGSRSLANGLVQKNGVMAHPLHTVFPRDSKVGKAIAWYAAGVYAYNAANKTKAYIEARLEERRREKYTINIESYDEEELYSVVFDWIIGQISTDDPVTDYNLVTIYKRPKNLVRRTSSTQNSFPMELMGRSVQISLDEKEERDGSAMSLRRNLVIRCKNQEDVNYLTDEIADLYDRTMYERVREEVDAGRAPRPYATWNGMSWSWKDLLPRDRESVVLHGDDKERLFEDVEEFRKQKKEYLRVEIPWHRGYLFHGPPGTGKTSLGLALASAYDMPIYFLPLNTVESDAVLTKAITGIESKEAVLILEDIDVVRATHSRDEGNSAESSKTLTLAGLLNVLDGINSPSGLITIMTTNHLLTLDPALIRPGRVDMLLEVGFLDDDQLRRLVLWYIDIEVNDFPTIKTDITPAQITGIVKDNMGKPEQCVEEIRRFINEANNKE